MITVFDMETGKILECSGQAAETRSPAMSDVQPDRQPQLALQLVEAVQEERADVRMPPDMALLDIAEVLARFR